MKNIAKTVFWLAAVFALSYMGIIYYSVGLMIMAFFCLILGIVEQLVLQMQMKQLAVKITTDVFATVCGENVTVQLLLHNPTKYPLLGLEVKVQMQEGQEKVTQVWKGSILAKEEERANVVLTPTHCQVTEIAVTQITGYSFLGLQKKKLAPKGQLQSVYVYPKAFDTDIRKLPKMVGDQIEEAEEPEDVEESGKHSVASTEIKGMREYQPGDRLRQINWKMTAKYDALYVQEY